MKRSEINAVLKASSAFFAKHHWVVLKDARWDVTDFGLGNFNENGLVLINLAEEPEYCEKLMYATKLQKTPAHYHKKKKEDIICRVGSLCVRLWNAADLQPGIGSFSLRVNGNIREIQSGEVLRLQAGERVTIVQDIWHEFWPESEECIIGEISTANDDLNDNFFSNPDIGRYPNIEEDETVFIKLISDR